MRKHLFNTAAVLLCAALIGAATTARAEIAPELSAKIDAALPKEPQAIPKYSRKLLVFTLCKAFAHASVGPVAEAVKRIGEHTGAYQADISDDPAVFVPANLQRYDAVLFDNTTGTLFEAPELRESLMAFVKGGRGVIGIHAATDCFYDWAEYGEMMGGYFDGHPWGAGDTSMVRIDDPAHPVCAPFAGQGFSIQDEIYQFRGAYSRDKLRVLLSLDPEHNDLTKKGVNRTDRDFAISWVRTWGQGRVFYCSLGHNDAVLTNRAVLAHYLAGIQYALGDLDADATPSAALPQEYFQKSQARAAKLRVEQLANEVSQYAAGKDSACLQELERMTLAAQGDAARRAETEAALAVMLEKAIAPEAKQFVAQQIYVLGADASVPVLARLLLDPAQTNIACYALERSASPAAGKALLDALEKTSGTAKIAIINALGQRKAVEAVPALLPSMRAECAEMATAAIAALGHIATPEARQALLAGRPGLAERAQAELDHALLEQAEGLACANNPKEAAPLYRAVYWEGLRVNRGAALHGLILTDGENAAVLTHLAMESNCLEMQRAAAMALCASADPSVIAAVASKVPSWPADAQELMVRVAAESASKHTVPLLRGALQSGNESLVLLGLSGIARLDETGLVNTVLPLLTHESPLVAKAAKDALSRMPGAPVSEALAQLMAKSQGAEKAALASILGVRHSDHSPKALLEAAADPDALVRVEAFRALGSVGGSVGVDQVLELLNRESDADARSAAESAVVTAARTAGIDLILQQCEASATSVEVRVALLHVLGSLGDAKGLPLLSKMTQSGQAAEAQAAIEALGKWPTAAAGPPLVQAAETLADAALKSSAWQSAITVLAKTGTALSPAESMAAYTQAMALAQSPEQKRLVLAGVAGVPSPDAIPLIKTCAGDADLKKEVTEALQRATVLAYALENSVPVLKAAALECDGNLGDWLRFITQLKDESKGINGGFRIEWTDEGLWLAAEVYDRSVVTGGAPELMGQRDSLQFAIDPLNERAASPTPNHIEIGIEQGEGKPQVHAWSLAQGADPALLSQIAAVVRHEGQLTTYEVKVPWAVLAPLKPEPGKAFGFDLAINDLDDSQAYRGAEWTNGLLTVKKPVDYKTLVLIGDL